MVVSSLCPEKDENIAVRVMRLCSLIGCTSVLEEPTASIFRVESLKMEAYVSLKH